MLKAKHKHSDTFKISWQDKINKEDDYICPDCRKEVIFVDATFKIKHFRHKAENGSCNHEPESKRHLEMKMHVCDHFPDYSPKEILEVNLGFGKPDIYIKDKKIAIECQASPISVKKFIERTLNYHKNNIHVLWIWDYNLYLSNKGIRMLWNIVRPLYFGRIYFDFDSSYIKIQKGQGGIPLSIMNESIFITEGSIPKRFVKENCTEEEREDLEENCKTFENGREYHSYKIKIARFYDKYKIGGSDED